MLRSRSEAIDFAGAHLSLTGYVRQKMHLIPYKGRKDSNDYEQNLLWKKENIYIMDNHRAAAWCWAQHVKPNDKYSIFHIDYHTDLLQSRLEEWVKCSPLIESLSIEEYLNQKWIMDRQHEMPLYSWDNYMPIFIKQREKHLESFSYMWHDKGDNPWFPASRCEAVSAPENLAYCLSNNNSWILNFDIDYFFTYSGDEEFIQLFSDDYIHRIATEIKQSYDNGHIKCLTIAISPEMCGGWENGIRALGIVLDALQIEPLEI
jgi:hypothetical protein